MRVAITECRTYDFSSVSSAIEKIIANSDFPDVDGKTVLLKPNILSDAKPEDGITTNPVIVEAMIQILKSRNASRIIVGDSPGLHSPQFHGKNSGIYDKAISLGAEWADFSSSPRLHEIDRHTKLLMASVLDDVDVVISLPKFKTHQLMYATGAVKNMFGLLPGLNKSQCHVKCPSREAFADLIVKIYRESKASYALMDGIIGMEGPGPANGTLRYVGLLIGSADGFLVDRAEAEVMGYDHLDIPIIRAGIRKGLTDDSPVYSLMSPENAVISDFRRIDISKKEGLFKALILPFFRRSHDRKKTKERPAPSFIDEKCIRCRRCIEICPAHALSLVNGSVSIDENKCIRCYCCHEMCPRDAIEIKKEP